MSKRSLSLGQRILRAVRPMRRRPLAVVLSGGGTIGAFQVGVIDVLARRGIRPDLIVGTSVGAINGAYWAMHPEPDAGAHLYDIWEKCKRQVFLPGGRLQVLRSLVANRNHLYPSDFVNRLLAQHSPDNARIEEVPVPLAITLCDALTGSRVVLRQGPLRQAVLASSAIPGLFAPVEVDGRQYIDGGVVANCDLEAASEAGVGQAIAIALSGFQPTTPAHGVGDVLGRTLQFMLRRQAELTARTLAGRLDVAFVQPALPTIPRIGEFDHTEELFELGRRYGEVLVDEHMDEYGNVLPGRIERLPGLEPAAAEEEDVTPAAVAAG
jgi:NTE family protein